MRPTHIYRSPRPLQLDKVTFIIIHCESDLRTFTGHLSRYGSVYVSRRGPFRPRDVLSLPRGPIQLCDWTCFDRKFCNWLVQMHFDGSRETDCLRI